MRRGLEEWPGRLPAMMVGEVEERAGQRGGAWGVEGGEWGRVG